MKKTLLTASALVFTLAVSAQKQPRLATFQDLLTKPAANQENLEVIKTLGVTIWSDDFTNPANWVIDNNGQTAQQFGWDIGSTAEGWWDPNGINSTSGGSYAELSNGDPTASPATQALNVVYTMTTAAPINITALGGTNQVSIQFEQYGARFNDLQEVQISTNGTTWTTVSDNLNESVLSSAGGTAYSNPNLKTINLANILSANPAPIWIRFSWTTNYPASATNPNVWITYGWYIDDVKLVTNPTNDLSVTDTYWGTEGLNYYQIPITQIAPIDFEAEVFNGGVNNQSNVKLNINVNAGQFIGSSAPATITSLDTVVLSVSTPFTPSTIGSYAVVRTLTADSTDDVPTNNVIQNIAFSVGNYIYARDNGTASGSTSNGTDGFEAGNLFDIWQDQTLKGINVRLAGGANGTVVGTEIFSKLYSIDANGDFAFESESDPFIVAAPNLNTNLVLPLSTPVNLVAGNTYLAVVGSFSTGLKISNAGTSAVQTSFFLDLLDNTWYYQTGTPYVRLNFDPVIGINELNDDIQASVYPNPTSTTLNVSLNVAGTALVSVWDLTGKELIAPQGISTGTAAIDVSKLSAGMYVVNIATETGITTKKFMKK
jgi:hypothetical protein